MTKEQFEARIVAYQNDIDIINKQILQLGSNISALNGAIQDCQYWIGEIEKEQQKLLELEVPKSD